MRHRLRVNPIACQAHGMCAELLPERITLDEWGYPLLDAQPLSDADMRHAVRAARACPTFALLIERERSTPAAERDHDGDPVEHDGGRRRR
jgi:ferredoxin